MQSLGYSFIYMVKFNNPQDVYKITDYIRNGVQLTRNYYISEKQAIGAAYDLRHQSLSVALSSLLYMAEASDTLQR